MLETCMTSQKDTNAVSFGHVVQTAAGPSQAQETGMSSPYQWERGHLTQVLGQEMTLGALRGCLSTTLWLNLFADLCCLDQGRSLHSVTVTQQLRG